LRRSQQSRSSSEVPSRWAWWRTALLATTVVGLTTAALVGGLARGLLDAVLWLLWFLDALPQILVWGIVCGIGGWLLLTAFLKDASVRSMDRPRACPTRRDLHDLAELIRDARRRPAARRALGRRLTEVAAPLHARCTGTPPKVALNEIHDGLWPPDPAMRAILHPPSEPDRCRSMSPAVYDRMVARVLDMLEQYDERGHIADH